MVGLDVRGYTSPAGDVRFQADTFITDGGGPTAAIGDPAKRPATPTISTAPTTPVDPAAKFEGDDAGDYFYKVQAVNRYGRSAAVDLVAGPAAVAVAEGDRVSFGVTPGSAVAVDWYEVFRTRRDGAPGGERLILRVANLAGAGEQVVDDVNDNLPGTTSAFQLQQNLESLSFKQLAPMVKIPLATVDTSIRWMQLLYGVLRLYTPGKNVLIRNIGRAQGFVGQP
jgi:hypothetical protein